MENRCHFCHNAVLEYQAPAHEHGHVYHSKCLEQAHASRTCAATRARPHARVSRHQH